MGSLSDKGLTAVSHCNWQKMLDKKPLGFQTYWCIIYCHFCWVQAYSNFSMLVVVPAGIGFCDPNEHKNQLGSWQPRKVLFNNCHRQDIQFKVYEKSEKVETDQIY